MFLLIHVLLIQSMFYQSNTVHAITHPFVTFKVWINFMTPDWLRRVLLEEIKNKLLNFMQIT